MAQNKSQRLRVVSFSFRAFLHDIRYGLMSFLNKGKSSPVIPDNNVIIHYDENGIKKAFPVLLANMNAYFRTHQEKKKQFKNELDFINNRLADTNPDLKPFYSIYPYDYVLDYDYRNTEVIWDEEAGMFYVLLGKHKLYYHKGFTNKEDIQKSFTFLSVEQDKDSPHRYLDNDFDVDSDDVVVDLGAAEGNFSLMIADSAKEIILVESNPLWMEALHKTFEPWKEKVRFVNKAVGDRNDERMITLDRLQNENKISVLKMDIDGAEMTVLRPAVKFIRENDLKIAITVYHRETDSDEIKLLLENNDYKTVFSKGFMLFVFGKLNPPFFRKGLIKARKKTKPDFHTSFR